MTTEMRLLVWNVNHRGSRRSIAEWIPKAIVEQNPTIVVLTEYIEGPDHEEFIRSLKDGGLSHYRVTTRGAENGIVRPGAKDNELRGNQVLIASTHPLAEGSIVAPAIDWLVPNVLHCRISSLDLDIIGFRMPAYVSRDPNKRAAWEWLLLTAEGIADRKTVIAGDFNTAPGDSDAHCGDCLELLMASSFKRVAPSKGDTFRHSSGTTRCIDHMFFSPSLRVSDARYSWEFQTRLLEVTTKPGIPDHAMLLADFVA